MYRNFYYFEEPTDTLLFGKYKGESFGNVVENDPKYIMWCIENLPEFYITKELREQIRASYPEIADNVKLDEHEAQKYWVPDNDDLEDDEPFYDDEPSYGHYAGTYAQDEAGFSDDDIDDVFDGDPDLYWNID